jgi:hypothetical protein
MPAGSDAGPSAEIRDGRPKSAVQIHELPRFHEAALCSENLELEEEETMLRASSWSSSYLALSVERYIYACFSSFAQIKTHQYFLVQEPTAKLLLCTYIGTKTQLNV